MEKHAIDLQKITQIMITSIKLLFSLLRNKYYADLFRSQKYHKLVIDNPRKALNLKWKANYGHSFPWDNPQTLDEKIAWLQVNTDTRQWSRLADKYEVRAFVKERGLNDILIPFYGVWDSVESIDFDTLPNQFVIKCTHDSGSTFLVKNKETENLDKLRDNLKSFMNREVGFSSFEPHYLSIKPRIIAEMLLENNNPSFQSKSLVDYKIWCFDGKPFLCFVCYDRYRSDTGKIKVVYDLYTMNPWRCVREGLSSQMKTQRFKDVPEPKNMDMMIHVAEKLSNGFPQVRVDLYNIDGTIYFSEMTFTACGGINYFYSHSTQMKMGSKITLP